MFKQFAEEFRKFTWFQKSFFVVVTLGLIFYGLLHGGLIKLPAARAKDCTQVKNFNENMVKMENNSFEPKDLQVKVCDKLLFINLDDQPKWPAVGPHPTHTSYPGFDAQRGLKKAESFEFQVNRPGTYTFHDHLHEQVIGQIVIEDK